MPWANHKVFFIFMDYLLILVIFVSSALTFEYELGMSATLTLTELVIERICDTIDTFPPLFARLCQVPGVVPSLMGGRVFKQCLTGFTKLADPARTSAEVVAFLLWEILRGRQFSVIEPARAASLKMSITVAHHVSENVDVRNKKKKKKKKRKRKMDLSRFSIVVKDAS